MKYSIIIGAVIIGAVLLLAWYLGRKKRVKKTGKVRLLRQEYGRKAGLPASTADKYIDDYISRLKEKHPGRSEEWYLEKMLFDLERDRR